MQNYLLIFFQDCIISFYFWYYYRIFTHFPGKIPIDSQKKCVILQP